MNCSRFLFLLRSEETDKGLFLVISSPISIDKKHTPPPSFHFLGNFTLSSEKHFPEKFISSPHIYIFFVFLTFFFCFKSHTNGTHIATFLLTKSN